MVPIMAPTIQSKPRMRANLLIESEYSQLQNPSIPPKGQTAPVPNDGHWCSLTRGCKTKLPAYRLVQVEWEDSAQPIAAWTWVDEHIPAPVRCLSVGYLVADKDGTIAIAPNLGDIGRERNQASGIIQIPRRCIIRIRNLRPT
jgi:hypothetical protein